MQSYLFAFKCFVRQQCAHMSRTQGCLVTPHSLHLWCPSKVFLASVSPALQSIQGFLTSFHHQSIIFSRELLGAILKVNQHYKRNSKMLKSSVGGWGGGSKYWLLQKWGVKNVQKVLNVSTLWTLPFEVFFIFSAFILYQTISLFQYSFQPCQFCVVKL